MWEEHPEYQKHQAKMIGGLIVLVLVLSIGYCIKKQDRDLLKNVLELAAAFLVGLALLPIFAWLIVKLLKRSTSNPTPKQKDDV